jgi:hypothetical protein
VATWKSRAVALTLAFIALGAWGVKNAYDEGHAPTHTSDPVAAYCQYGAVSPGQLEGCEMHVSRTRALAAHSNAGRYARGDLEECLVDAGPFCREQYQLP